MWNWFFSLFFLIYQGLFMMIKLCDHCPIVVCNALSYTGVIKVREAHSDSHICSDLYEVFTSCYIFLSGMVVNVGA